jgi:hypothetical protein
LWCHSDSLHHAAAAAREVDTAPPTKAFTVRRTRRPSRHRAAAWQQPAALRTPS